MLTSASVIGFVLSPALSRFAAAAARSAIAPEMTPKGALPFHDRRYIDCLLGEKVSRAENNNKAIGVTVARFAPSCASHAAVKPVRFASGDCRLGGVPPRLLRMIDVCCRGCARTRRGGRMVEVDRRVGVDEIVSCVDV